MKQLLRICLTGAFFLLFEGLLSPMLADNGKSDKPKIRKQSQWQSQLQ